MAKVGHSAGIFGQSSMGATAIDALDTLFIMGLKDEYKQGRDWVAEHLNFDVVSDVICVQRIWGPQGRPKGLLLSL